MAFPLGCLKLESNHQYEVILFFPLSLSHDRVSFLLSVLQNDLFLQSISLCGCSVTSSPFSHCWTRRLKPKFPLGVDKALMHTPVCLCSISDHIPQSQSHLESPWARGWEVCKHTSFLLLLLLLGVGGCERECTPPCAYLYAHLPSLFLPWHLALLHGSVLPGGADSIDWTKRP